MSTENVESIPSVVINEESKQSPNKLNRSIKSSKSRKQLSLYKKMITLEMNDFTQQLTSEITKVLSIHLTNKNIQNEEIYIKQNAQLINLHDTTHKAYLLPPTITPESDSCIRKYINFINKKCSTLTQTYIQNEDQSNSSKCSYILHDKTILHNTKTPVTDVLTVMPSSESQSSLVSVQDIPHQPADIKPPAVINTISTPSTSDNPLSDFCYTVLPSSTPNCRVSPISGGYMQPYASRLPLLVQLAKTAHRLPHHLSYAQLVNLVPFDPGGK